MLLEFIESPQGYSSILYIISVFSVPIHIFGGYCIFVKTPIVMKSVKWALLNLHFWSAALDLSLSLIFQPYFCTPVYAGFALGLMRWVEVIRTDVLVVGATLIYKIVPVSMISMFENRFFVLFVNGSSWRYLRYPFLAFNYILAFAYCTLLYLEVPVDQKKAKRIMFDANPQACEIIPDKSIVFAMDSGYNYWTSLRDNVLTCFVLMEIIVLVVLLRVKMNRAINNIQSSVSLDTLQKQKKFMRALNLQIALPILVIFIPATVGAAIANQGVSLQFVDNLFNIITSLHGVTATILMIYLQKPYRDSFLEVLCCRKQVESRSILVKSQSMICRKTLQN